MPDHYDEKGNIPGPTRWQSEEDKAVLDKENIWIDSLREGTVDVGNQILDTLKYGGAVKGGVKLPKIKRLPPSQHKTINITPQKADKLLDDVLINRTDKIIPKYSSGPIVQTNQGTMYRPTPGTMQSTFQSVNPEFEQGYVAPGYKDIYKVQTRLINQNLTGSGKKFNWNAYRNGLRQNKKSGRTIATLYSTTPHSKIANWETHRQGLVGAYTSLYGKAMDKYGYTPSDIDVDHIFTLQQSMAIYHDVDWGGNLYNKIQERILSRGYKPGNASSNLTAVDKQTHGQKSKFFNTLHGPNGTRFFNKTRMQKMTASEEGRMEVLDEYLDQIDEGARILNEGQAVWETLYSPNEIMPEQIVEKLAHIELNQYSTPRLKTIIEEIIRDTELQDAMGRADLIEQVERQSAIDEPMPYKLEDAPLPKPYKVQSKKAKTRKFIKKVTEELPPDYGPLLENIIKPNRDE